MDRISFDTDGLSLDGTFIGVTLLSSAADMAFGTVYRKEYIRIGGKIERVQRIYDEIGLVCLECLDVGKIKQIRIF